jgi:SAM-dependent methyltransferase
VFSFDDGMSDDGDGDADLPAVLSAEGRTVERVGIYDAAEWYDVDYAGYLGELMFYRRVCESLRPGGWLVELGAGTGRLTIPLCGARNVATIAPHPVQRVHAVEPAASMRARLERKLTLGLAGSCHVDVEDAFAHTFVGPDAVNDVNDGDDGAGADVVIFPFNGILHLDTPALLEQSMGHIFQKLRPGGRFALDMTGPYWESIRRGRVPWGRADERVHPSTGERFWTCDRSAYDPATRVMRIDIRYAMVGANTGEVHGETLIETSLFQHMWTTGEILGAVVRAGFHVEVAYGDVDLAPFSEGSPRLLMVAVRP